MSRNRTTIRYSLAIVAVLGVALPLEAGHARPGGVAGLGYAAFDAGGAPGTNWYRVEARRTPRGEIVGWWEADVFIDFGGGAVFDFEALYTLDCLEIDHRTREAWVEGTIVSSNDPANVGNRAFLYVRDGGPEAEDAHAITPLGDGETCDQRPEPDFMEVPQLGNYIVR